VISHTVKKIGEVNRGEIVRGGGRVFWSIDEIPVAYEESWNIVRNFPKGLKERVVRAIIGA